MAVSKALLIFGMLAPKLLLAAVLATGLAGLSTGPAAMAVLLLTAGAVSVARSQDVAS